MIHYKCPKCGVNVEWESVRRKYAPDSSEQMQDAEIAAETAFENHLYGVRDY